VTDEKRGEFAVQTFRAIKTEEVRRGTAAEIAILQAAQKYMGDE